MFYHLALTHLVVGLGIVEDQLHVLHDLHGRPVHQALEPVLDDLEVHRVLDDLVVVWNLRYKANHI